MKYVAGEHRSQETHGSRLPDVFSIKPVVKFKINPPLKSVLVKYKTKNAGDNVICSIILKG